MMTYYINPIWFYLINISEGIKTLFGVAGGIVLILSLIALYLWGLDNAIDFTNMDDDEKKVITAMKKIIIASFVSIFICVLIPSKETCVEMMIASQVTHENVSATKEEIYEFIDYVTDKIDTSDEE